MISSLVLAIDVGTSSCRAAFFDLSGERVEGSLSQRVWPLSTSVDGMAEFHPAMLLTEVTACVAETFERQRVLGEFEVHAAGISCFWHSLIGIGKDGRPVTPVITWADSRCREDAATLRGNCNEREVHARTGCMIRASFWPAKLAWLKRTRLSIFKRVKKWISPGEWLQQAFCGASTCANAMATGTGIYRPGTLCWDRTWLDHLEMSDTQLGVISDAPLPTSVTVALEFPEMVGAKWYPAIGDGAAGNLGSGASRPGLAALNAGTSAALRVMHSDGDAVAPFGLFCYRVDAARFLIGGAVSNAGNLRAWCLSQLRIELGPEALENELAARAEPLHGLAVLPFWNAERAPYWREEMTGVISGLRQSTTALDLLQATTEGVYQRLALIANLVVADGAAPKISVSGGIQHSPALMQKMSDVLGRPLWQNKEQEASLRGAAVYALEREIPGFRNEPSLGICFRPRKKIASIFAKERVRHQLLESLLAGHWE